MLKLPIGQDFETKKVLKKLADAKLALGRLNGVAQKIPNERILINNLILAEAKESSAIENIITTYDELYKASATSFEVKATKEVKNYKDALLQGVLLVKEKKILVERHINEIQNMIEPNKKGYAKVPRHLKNPVTNDIIYSPPETYDEICALMQNLEIYINDDGVQDIDPLIKMAIIHYQFEAIHPFLDGNGRTGRIINILYLILKKQLDLPILYLSGYIIKHLSYYYELLQKIQQKQDWQDWILYMLDAVEKTSMNTIKLIDDIIVQMQETKEKIKEELPNIYNKELVEVIFWHTYTKIDFVEKYMQVTQKTAAKYLHELVRIGVLRLEIKGREKYFINIKLYDRFKKGIFL